MGIVEAIELILFAIVITPAVILLSGALELRLGLCFALYFWHLAASCTYYIWAQTHTADSNGYYNIGLYQVTKLNYGTDFVTWVTQGFIVLGFSKFLLFLIFGAFGLLGLLLLAASMNASTGQLRKREELLLIALLFLPGPHFWTSMIGKDAITFLGASVLIYCLVKGKQRVVGIASGIALFSCVRPHIGLLAIGALAVAFTFAQTKNRIIQFGVLLFMMGALFFSIDFVAEYVGIKGEVTTESVGAFVEMRQSNDTKANTAVDLTEMNAGLRLFLFLFTPLFDRGLTPLRLIVSMENLILLVIVVYCTPAALRVVFRSRHPVVIYCLVFFGMGALILSSTVANQGLAIRQKMMLIPALYLLASLSLWVKSEESKFS